MLTEDGYSFDLAFELPTGVDVSTDIADAKPGEANLNGVFTATINVTNTTSGRNAQIPGISLAPAWYLDSPMCADPSPFPSFTRNWVDRRLEDRSEQHVYCTILSQGAGIYDVTQKTTQLEVGQSKDYEINGNTGAITVAETSASTIADSWTKPDVWIWVTTDDIEDDYPLFISTGIWFDAIWGSEPLQ